MKRLMILADDLTGAVDTGAFPVACGKEAVVYTEPDAYADVQQELVCVNMGTRGGTGKKPMPYMQHLRSVISLTMGLSLKSWTWDSAEILRQK